MCSILLSPGKHGTIDLPNLIRDARSRQYEEVHLAYYYDDDDDDDNDNDDDDDDDGDTLGSGAGGKRRMVEILDNKVCGK